MKYLNTIIRSTGSYVPEYKIENKQYISNTFFEKDESRVNGSGEEIVDKFKDITGIVERRWVKSNQKASEIATRAAKQAIDSAGVDKESIDHIIVASNFGDVIEGTIQTDFLPSIAARVKHNLEIVNPSCVAYDLIFGCPGWIQGVIQADSFIKSGLARRVLVIGTETLSRVMDIYDRDTMIFSDGAGAAILEGVESDEKSGILASATVTHTKDEAYYLYLGKSNKPESDPNVRYIKMHGRKIYEYSLNNVPKAIKEAVDKSGVSIEQVKKVIIHQANEKMDEAIVQRFFRQYGIRVNTDEVMPMNIHELGNSSVATVPTLYDMILNKKIKNHTIHKDDIIVFASVGAGMSINALVYKQ